MGTAISLAFTGLILIWSFIVVAYGRFSVKSCCLCMGLADSVSRSFCSFSESGFCCNILCTLKELNAHWFLITAQGSLAVWRYLYESPTASLFLLLSFTCLFLVPWLCISIFKGCALALLCISAYSKKKNNKKSCCFPPCNEDLISPWILWLGLILCSLLAKYS